MIDRFCKANVEFRFLRFRPNGDPGVRSLIAHFEHVLDLGPSWGYIGRDGSGDGLRTIWIPRPPRLVLTRDEVGRSQILAPIESGWRHEGIGGISCDLPRTEGGAWWSATGVLFGDSDWSWYHQLEHLSGRVWPHLMKSDWFKTDSPSRLWDSLIDGDIFDPRMSLCGKGRFRCQQCANAWWTYLQIIGKISGSPLMKLLAREIAWSSRVQFDAPGGWQHGYWYEEPETHVRFFVDGINLLLNEALASGDQTWIVVAERAMDEVQDQYTDSLVNGGLWFLHDSVEAAGQLPRNQPPDLGQSQGNTLCLNTHTQTLIALWRLAEVQEPGRARKTREQFELGVVALRRLLELDSAPIVYRLLGVFLCPVVESKGHPGLTARFVRIAAFRVFWKVYWWVRRSFPRMVYPNGFIERDMASAMLADDYHVVNLKDLLLLHKACPQPWMDVFIRRGWDFLQRLDLKAALLRSPLFVEVADVHWLVGRLLDRDLESKINETAVLSNEVYEATSLDAAHLEITE